ncbi:hypothetical protein [Oceanobacillus chungangensis]|uniref:Uncharacterized protein n=1 Tax=Oceanobacillus chungangensis TaxID=1229152 RepID=A0A3D8PIQ6_9BACI|nr:hypothetical protein [Oceanobacillus chungangensis]RDW15934.1 hypothetical protein CWR45_15680 [Oceanobacillus chungangensis]
MSNNQYNHKQKSLIIQLIRDYINENIDELKHKDQSRDNSFVFLESETLHLIITSILTHLDDHPTLDVREANAESSVLEEIELYLDEVMEESKMAFEDVINILKKKT